MARPATLAGLTVLLGGQLLAAELEAPPPAQIDRCEADPVTGTSGGAFSRLRVSCDDVLEFVARAKMVSESEWRHEYSHVAFGDRTGRLTLRDGIVLRSLGPPGGLSRPDWPDGRATYLVRCCAERPPRGGEVPARP